MLLVMSVLFITSIVKKFFTVKVCFHHILGYIIGEEGKVMSIHEKMSQFTPSQETWSSYAERLQYYFVANDVQDQAMKKAILLTVCSLLTFLPVAQELASTQYARE